MSMPSMLRPGGARVAPAAAGARVQSEPRGLVHMGAGAAMAPRRTSRGSIGGGGGGAVGEAGEVRGAARVADAGAVPPPWALQVGPGRGGDSKSTPAGHMTLHSGSAERSLPSVETLVAMMQSSGRTHTVPLAAGDLLMPASAAAVVPGPSSSPGASAPLHALHLTNSFARRASSEAHVVFSGAVATFNDAALEEQYHVHESSRQRALCSPAGVLAPLCAVALVAALARSPSVTDAALSRVGAMCAIVACVAYRIVRVVRARARERAGELQRAHIGPCVAE